MTKDSTSVEEAKDQMGTLSRAEETLGSFLKRHRQDQGKSLEEIAAKTRIHASTLRAIEEDNPKALPAEVFTRGFVRNYAQYLGLDPNEAVALYIAQNAGGARSTENLNIQEVLAGEIMAEAWTFPLGRFGVWLLIAGAFFLAGYLLLDLFNSSSLSDVIQKQEAQPQAFIKEVPLLGRESGVSAQTSLLPEAGLKSDQGEKVRQVEGEQGLVLKRNTEEIIPVTAEKTVRERPGQNQPQQAIAQSLNYVLEARFTETTWVSVQIDKEKKKPLTYQPGDHVVWQAEKNISLLVGNAGGVTLTLNGKPLPSLGKSMQIGRISVPVE